MIATITMNPAVDKSTNVERLIPEKKLRCSELIQEAGGGGINVSKAIAELGGDTLAIFPSGGANGQVLQEILRASEIPFKAVPVLHDTRESFTALETSTNSQYRFIMPGAGVSRKEIDACVTMIHSLDPAPSIIVASGSLPPGAPDNFYAMLAATVKERGSKLIVDTSGLPLHLAAKEGVYLLKPNLSELASLVGRSKLELDEVDRAAREVIDKGECEIVVVSLGPAGALLMSGNSCEKVAAPTVKKLSTVGAGDSMVAGMAFMLEKDRPLPEVLRFGVACGTAATMNPGSHLFKKDDVYKLFEWINLHTI